jgi:hypothetical protein
MSVEVYNQYNFSHVNTFQPLEVFYPQKSLEISSSRTLLLKRINTWIHHHIGLEQLERYLLSIRKLQDSNDFYSSDLTVPVFIFAERFVQKNGKISKDKLFLLLLISTGVAIKMFEEVKKKQIMLM